MDMNSWQKLICDWGLFVDWLIMLCLETRKRERKEGKFLRFQLFVWLVWKTWQVWNRVASFLLLQIEKKKCSWFWLLYFYFYLLFSLSFFSFPLKKDPNLLCQQPLRLMTRLKGRHHLGVSWGNNPRSIMFSDLLVKSISEGLDNFIRSMISELSSCKFVSLPRSFTCSSCSKSLLVLPLGRVWHGEIEQHLWSFSYWGGEIERSSPCMGCRSSSELEQVIVFL